MQCRGSVSASAPVVVAPGEAFGDQLLGLEALHELDDLKVGDVDLGCFARLKSFSAYSTPSAQTAMSGQPEVTSLWWGGSRAICVC